MNSIVCFTLVPLGLEKELDVMYIASVCTKVFWPSPAALRQGIYWVWSSFPQATIQRGSALPPGGQVLERGYEDYR